MKTRIYKKLTQKKPLKLTALPASALKGVFSHLDTQSQSRLVVNKKLHTLFKTPMAVNHLLQLLSRYELSPADQKEEKEKNLPELKIDGKICSNPILKTINALLKKYPEAALEKGQVVDHAGKLHHCSPLEFAYRSRNFIVCDLIVEHAQSVPEGEQRVALQVEQIDQGQTRVYDLAELTGAQEAFVGKKLLPGADAQVTKDWENIGKIQAQLPAWIAQLWCAPAPFDPAPNFLDAMLTATHLWVRRLSSLTGESCRFYDCAQWMIVKGKDSYASRVKPYEPNLRYDPRLYVSHDIAIAMSMMLLDIKAMSILNQLITNRFKQFKQRLLSPKTPLTITDLLAQLKAAYENYPPNSPLREAAEKVWQEASKLNAGSADKESLAASIKAAINVLRTPRYETAIRKLQENASQQASGKSSLWKKFLGVLAILAGVALIALGIAGIPFSSGSSSALGFYIGGSLLTAGGAGLFYRSRQKNLSQALSQLATVAPKVDFKPPKAPEPPKPAAGRRLKKI